MNINYFDCGFPYIVIDNFYTKDELDLIWEELDYLSYDFKLKSPEETGAAYVPPDESGNNERIFLKNNRGIFLEEIFLNRECSNINKVNRKIFTVDLKQHPSWFFKNIQEQLVHDTTLLSYYEDTDTDKAYYAPHRDNAIVTVLSWFYRGSCKKFKGGDLYFPDYENQCVEVKNNRIVIFPSFIRHAVDNVVLEKIYRGKYFGRYCLTTFIKDNRRGHLMKVTTT